MGKDLFERAVVKANEISNKETSNDKTAYLLCESKLKRGSNGFVVLNSFYCEHVYGNYLLVNKNREKKDCKLSIRTNSSS